MSKMGVKIGSVPPKLGVSLQNREGLSKIGSVGKYDKDVASYELT